MYKCTDFYDPDDEHTLRWDDPDLGIAWPLPAGIAPVLSAKDAAGASFRSADQFRVRVLLTGGSGQLGRALRASLPAGIELVAPGSADFDLTRDGDAERWVGQTRPALVINAAAYTQVDRAEDEPAAAFAVNQSGAAAIAQAAAAAGARVIHVSTDFVFDGGRRRRTRRTAPPRRSASTARASERASWRCLR